LIGVDGGFEGFDGFAFPEYSSDELFEADGFVLIGFVDVTMDGFAGLIFALQTEEGVILTSFVETDHSCFLLVETGRVGFDFDGF